MTFAHTEYNKKKFTNLKNIRESIKNYTDLFHRNIIYKKIKLDKSYPDYILKNKEKFDYWIAK